MGDVAQFPMQVKPVDSTDDQLTKVNKFTQRELKSEDVFIFEGVVSDDSLDSFKTRMDPGTTLVNYAEDLKKGVPLMAGHDTTKLPFGRSFDSEVRKKDDLTQVVGKFYMPRDTSSNGVRSNDMIRNIEAGLLRDMSVGFMAKPNDYVCSADDKPLGESRYFPGDPLDDGTEAYYWIKNGHLREVSAVYKASNGNAFIDKARQLDMDENRIKVLENGLGTRAFGALDKSFFDTKKRKEGGNSSMTIAEIKKAVEDGDITLSALKSLVSQLDKDNGGDDDKKKETGRMVRSLFTDEDLSKDFFEGLKAEAEAGRAYKSDLIDEAVKARAAVQGDGFNKEHFEDMLKRSDVAYIKEERDSYSKMKSDKFTSGRQVGGNGGSDGEDDAAIEIR